MQTVATKLKLRSLLSHWRKQNQTIALVPTMGNLHQGHLSLVKVAKQSADKVVCSIFVNSLQFSQNEDLSSYPRTLKEDYQQLSDLNVDLVFMPTDEEMYPVAREQQCFVDIPILEEQMCGEFSGRPGHFRGVLTVVAKLFHLIQPDYTVFGEKDYQQLALIQRMTAELDLPIKIIPGKTVRNSEGLALSSRNHYLDAIALKQASGLHKTLLGLMEFIQQGRRNYQQLEQHAVKTLLSLGFEPDYIHIRHRESFMKLTSQDTHIIILAAVKLEQARLIDNIFFDLD